MSETRAVAEWMAWVASVGNRMRGDMGAVVLTVQEAVLDALNDRPDDWWEPLTIEFDDDMGADFYLAHPTDYLTA